MAFLIIAFYVFGLLCGVYLGKTFGYDKLDEVEVRLQDGDYVGLNDRLMDLGRAESYHSLVEYMDNEFVSEK